MFGAAISRRPSAGSWCWALRSGTPTSSKPGPTRGCRRNAVCLTSCLTSQTSSAPGCCCCSVHRPAPTTPCERYRLLNRHRTHGPTTRLFGRHSKSVWGAYHRPRRNRPGRSHRCQLFMADSACSQRSGRPRRRTGRHGWMRSPSSGLACPAQLIVAWRLWSKAQRARSRVCARQRRLKTYKEKAGKRAPAGTLPTKAPGRHNPAMQARANGLTAGSFTRRGLATFTIATAGSAPILTGVATLARRGTRWCMAVSSAERTSIYFRPAGHTARVAAPLAFTPAAQPKRLRPQPRLWAAGRRVRGPWPRLPSHRVAGSPSENRRAGLGARGPRGGRIRWASHPSTMARAHNRTWSAS